MRVIAAIFVGFILCVVVVLVGGMFSLGFTGEDFAYDVVDDRVFATAGFCALVLAVGLVGAVVGGYAAAKVGGRKRASAVVGLIGLILVLGAVSIVVNLKQDEHRALDGQTLGEVPKAELASYVKQPTWYVLGVPVVGAVGVLIGGAVGRPKNPPADARK